MFDASASTWLPSVSSASAKYSSSSTQKSRLKRRLSSAASCSSRSANAGSFQTQPREARAAHLGVVGVALLLAGGAREAGQSAVAVGDRVRRVLPALVLEPGLLVAALVPDVAVAHEVGVLVDPGERGARLDLEVAHEPRVARPALVLVEQHHVERRRVGAAVVRRVRPLLEGGHLAVAHLVQDPARILVAEVVQARALPLAERAQRGLGQLRRERQRLQAREDAVAPEHRHEPGQAGRRQALAAGHWRREAQRGEIDQAAVVGRLERRPSRTRDAAPRRSSDRGSSACPGRERLGLAVALVRTASDEALRRRRRGRSSTRRAARSWISKVRPFSSISAGVDELMIVSRRNVSRS